MLRNQKYLYSLILLLAFTFLGIGELLAEVQVKVDFPRKTTRVGDRLRFKMTIESTSQDEIKQLILPESDQYDFQRTQSGQSSSISLQNGKAIYSFKMEYGMQFIPRKEGTYPLRIGVSTGKGDVYADEVTIVVQPPGAPTPTPEIRAPQAQNAQSKYGIVYNADITKQEAYVGEEVLLTYTIFTPATQEFSVNHIRRQREDKGRFQNFWQETMTLGNDYLQTIQANGTTYYKRPLFRHIMYPLTPGTHTIEPSRLICEVVVGRRGVGFFNLPFGRKIDVPIASETVSVTVKPLPEAGQPAEFKGAVGQYQLNSEVDTTQVLVGEPVTLNITLKGHGNLQNAPAPIMPDLSKFDQYEPVKTQNVDVTVDGIKGNIEYSYVLVPHDVKANVIGPVQFPYFDPQKEEYVDLRTNPIQLTVLPSDRRNIGITAGNRRIITMVGEDFRFNAVSANAVASIPLAVYRSFNAWLWILLPSLVLIAVFVYKQRETFLALNPTIARSRKAPRLAKRLLAEADQAIAHGDAAQAYQKMSKAVTDYISNRWDVACTGMTSVELKAHLSNQNVPDNTIEQVDDLLQEFDSYRFAQSTADQEQLQHDRKRTHEILLELMNKKGS